MAENSENIEAKLCAYVEGELDEQGKVEIERHLEAHPNHRRLLAELMATRDLLRFLPREQAPPELAEFFNAQLERSALLDGAGIDGPSGAATYRGNLMPRLMAMAAIVLLAVGLGAIVYFALPRGESGTQLAMPARSSSPVIQSVKDEVEAAASADAQGQPAPPRVAGGVPDERRLSKAGPAPAPAKTGEVFAAKGGAQDATVAGKVGGGGGAGNDAEADRVFATEPVYLIVSADNPNETLREVSDMLSRSETRWEPVPESPPAPLNLRESQTVLSSPRAGGTYARLELDNALQKKASYGQRQYGGNQRQQQQELAKAPSPSAQPGQAAQQERALARAGSKEGPAEEPAKPAATPAPSEPTESKAEVKAKASSAADSALASAERKDEDKDRSGVGAPAPRERSVTNSAPPNANADAVAQAEKNQPAQQVDEGEKSEIGGIVAYGMTPRQVMELSQKLNRAPQAVELIADNEELQVANESLQQQQVQQQQELQRPSDVSAATPAPSPALEDATAKRDSNAEAPLVAAEPVPPTSQKELDNAKVAAKPSAASPPRGPVAMKKEGPAPASPAAAASGAGAGTAGKLAQRPASPTSRPDSYALAEQPAQQPKDGYDRGKYYNSRQGAGRPNVIRRGEKLSVTVDELAGPDLGSTHAVTVAPDGSVTLPKLNDPVTVEGLSRPEAATKIAEAYRAAQVIDKPTVFVEPIETRRDSKIGKYAEPANRAASEDKAEQNATSNGVQTTTAPATTQSATTDPTSQPAEQRLDVVIIVQRASSTSYSTPANQQAAPNAAQQLDTSTADKEPDSKPAPTQPTN